MAPGMSPEEAGGLLRTMRMGGAEGALKGHQVRLYDFRRPDKFSKDQLRTLVTLHENFCRALTTSLAASLRTSAQVEATDVEQCPFSQFLKDLHDPTILGILSMAPFNGNPLLEIEPDIAFPMLDRLLGGPGKGVVRGRAVTDIEVMVMRRIFNTILEALVEPWRSVAEVTPRLEGLETNPLFVQFIPPTDVVAYLRFSVRVGPASGEMKLCLPYSMLEPYLPQLSARYWLVREKAHRPAGEEAKIVRELSDVSVPMTARLGHGRITVGELLDLEVGDVIQLDTSTEAPVDLLVKGRRKFRGRAGRSGRHLAVQVTEVLDEGE